MRRYALDLLLALYVIMYFNLFLLLYFRLRDITTAGKCVCNMTPKHWNDFSIVYIVCIFTVIWLLSRYAPLDGRQSYR